MIVNFSEEERQRVVAAIKAAEHKTSGEIVVTAARESDDYIHVPLHIAAAAALATPFLFLVPSVALSAPWLLTPIWHIFAIQMLVFIFVGLLLSLPALRAAITPRRLMNKYAHRNAASQFLALNAHATAGRNGLLIFVSQLERYVEIIGDTAITAGVPQSEWQAIVDAMLPLLRAGRATEALVMATARCGDVLGRYFPPSASNPDELPDRFVVLE